MQMMHYLEPVVRVFEYTENQTGTKEIHGVESIEFQNVSFQYPNTQSKVLDDVSFRINKGDLVGLIGLNGAGKTTIVKLICGFYKPTKGVIKINDIPIHEYEKTSYC